MFIVFDEWAGLSQGWGGVSFTVMGRWLASQVNRRIKKCKKKKKKEKEQTHIQDTAIHTHVNLYAIKHPGTHRHTWACAGCGEGV